ncbi:hypothetical protein EJ02DRAFT_201454 [Clathrospora elynae]|uniref:Uncharacterized protein n=1 Tax=Clathrospora elynae TaxID=706981 RepID=A0A6A5SP30_9PLEO|nr:hypothetical protein EJ02DRAFT_201454 [Clathrospora elynae]
MPERPAAPRFLIILGEQLAFEGLIWAGCLGSMMQQRGWSKEAMGVTTSGLRVLFLQSLSNSYIQTAAAQGAK